MTWRSSPKWLRSAAYCSRQRVSIGRFVAPLSLAVTTWTNTASKAKEIRPLFAEKGPDPFFGTRRVLGRLFAFHGVGLVHVGLQAMLGQRLRKPLPDLGTLVGVVDLVSAQAPADPGLGNALGIADRDALGLEREVARRRGAGIEVLVEPEVRRHDHGAFAPVVALGRLALGPHQAEALSAENDHVRARPMRMGLLVGADRELRDVA